jgi:hypothetical protein
MRVIAFDPYLDDATFAEHGVERVPTLEALLEQADHVSVHAPLTPETRHLFNRDAFARMKPTAILVNTARGPIVEEAALVEALRNGQIAGAGLDVFEVEPVPAGNPLLEFENVVLTPHSAFYSEYSNRHIKERVGQTIVEFMNGKLAHRGDDPEPCGGDAAALARLAGDARTTAEPEVCGGDPHHREALEEGNPMRPNTALRAWRDGKQTVGAWLSTPSSHSAEVMAHAGFDWLCVDMQHGLIGESDCYDMLRAISTTNTIPFVRVPWNEPWIIMKVLDAGAYGVVVPLVNNKEEAERAVWAANYPPPGGRSSGPARATLYAGSDYQAPNDEIAVIA